MKAALLFALLIFLSFAVYCQTWSQAKHAANHEGEVINTVGFISEVRFSADPTGIPIIIRVDNRDSTRLSLLMIVRSDFSSKETLRSQFLHQYVQVKGRVYLNNGRPQINLDNREQIKIAVEPNHRINEVDPE